MFSNLGLHVIQFPSGRFGFVGSIPTALATMRPATTADVMGGRCFRGADGTLQAWQFPVFDSAEDARAFAASKGFETRSN